MAFEAKAEERGGGEGKGSEIKPDMSKVGGWLCECVGKGICVIILI